jgi:hypothetical protein
MRIAAQLTSVANVGALGMMPTEKLNSQTGQRSAVRAYTITCQFQAPTSKIIFNFPIEPLQEPH